METRSASLRKLFMRVQWRIFTVLDSCTRLKLQTCSKYQNEIRDSQYNRLCGLVVRTNYTYTCDRWFDFYLHVRNIYFFLSFFSFVFGA